MPPLPSPLPDDTIVALATPEGGALGVIRISGPRAFALGRALLFRRDGSPRFPGESPVAPRRIHHAIARDARGEVDECLAHFAKAPASYTGEDTLELSAHGGPATLRRLLSACVAAGARMAAPGEFTRRAFLNGKLDLVRAEAVGDLVAARTERARDSSFLQLSGALSPALYALRDRLLDLDARVEAWLDHPEEDIDPVEPAELADAIARIEGEVRAALDRSRYEIALREGVEIVVCGRPNVGKSSVFNRLLGRARAIVSDAPGTTRDVVSETLSLDGIPARLLDTAGVRDGGDAVETEGHRRALHAIERATLRLVVLDGASPLSAEDLRILGHAAAPRLLAINKSDLPPLLPSSALPDGEETVAVSCLTGDGFPALEAALSRALGEVPHREGLLVTNARQAECLGGTLAALTEAREALASGLALDLVADSLRRAARGVAEILGECYTEELLDRIFSTFCIGK